MKTPQPRVALYAAALVALLGPQTACAQSRPFTAEDMLDIVQISGPVAVSPNGDRLAFVLPDLSDEWNVGERQQRGSVHVVRLDGRRAGAPEVVGRAQQRSSLPEFSPDGSRLAVHLEGPVGGQLGVWDLESRTMALVGEHYPGRATARPQWAGNGRVVYQRPAAPAPDEETPRIHVMESSDEVLPGDAFFRQERRAGLAVVDVSTGAEQTLVPDGGELLRFAVSPDGAYVVVDVGGARNSLLRSLDEPGSVTIQPRAGERLEWLADGRVTWRSQGRLMAARPDRLAAATAILAPLEPAFANMTWSPDGTRFASLVADPTITDPEIEAPQRGMYTIARPFTDLVVVSPTDGQATNLTSSIPDRIGSPVWSANGASLFYVATDNETYDETVYRHDVRTGETRVLTAGRASFDGLVPVPGGVIASIQTATAPADLWRINAISGERTRVTELNPQLSQFTFSEPELFHFDSQDGDRLGALLFRPSGSTADVPVVTYVYEKLTPGIHGFQARQQIFATHGYAVLMPNVKVKVGETATSFVRSAVPAVAAVHAMGFTNGRACLWGGSFGAYATSFVITQTNIFDCAVSRATPPELFRNWASGRDRDSDNIESGQARMGGSPFEVPERYLSQSAFFHLDKVETPVLITHGLKDYTILHEEGAMMFYALRRLGKTATFVSYRDGDHSLYRHSRDDALDVHRRMLDWFAKYLQE